MDPNGQIPKYTLCNTYDTVASAAESLSTRSTLILYCQGSDLGLPDGKLSIIALSDPAASEVFLFDVISLRDKDNPSIALLSSLLQSPDITKLVWDGRTYAYELADTYGIFLQGTLDLQLVEASTRGSTDKGHRVQHTRNHLRRITDGGTALVLPDDIHKLLGLFHCAGLYHLPNANPGKNGE